MIPFPLIKTKLPIHLMHFSVTFLKIFKKRLIPATTSFSCHLADPEKNSLFMRQTDEKEIEQKIKTVKDNKGLGPNSIRTKIIKVHSKTLSKPLAELINLSLIKANSQQF